MRGKYNKIKITRNIFFSIAIVIAVIYAIAWLTTGIEVHKYYKICLDKTNYSEVERVVSFKDSNISFINNRTITGPDNIKYFLTQENEQILKDNNFLAELHEGETVLLSIAPSEYNTSYSVVAVQKEGAVYLDFESGFQNWMEEPRYSLDYFYSGSTSILILGIIAFIIFLFFQILCVKTKAKLKRQFSESEKEPAQKRKIDNNLIVLLVSISLVNIFGIACLVETFVFINAKMQYSAYSDLSNYNEVLCQIFDNDGCRDLKIIDENHQNQYASFAILSKNAEIAFNKGFYDERQIGDHVIIAYIHGDYHGTPLYIAGIKTDNKVYLDLEEGISIMSDWRKGSPGAYFAWFIPSLSIFLGSTIIIIYRCIKRSKKQRHKIR